jgi:hypothetical protein
LRVTKEHRPGGSSLSQTEGKAAPKGTPGKATLTQELASEPGLARVEGATLFSGPDPTISSEAPALATPDKTDAEYEKSMGVEAAIKSKKMLPVAGIDGQSFVATGVAGKKDGKVTFTFDRAFIGDYKHPAIAKEIRGVHVSISAALSGLGEHKEVKLIQILRNIKKVDGKIVTGEPDTAKRKARSGWDDDKAKSKGWRVDGLDSDTSPFYVSDEVYGNHGSDKKAAKLRDTPGDWTTDTNMGKEFRTCAVSYKDGKGTVLACVDWGYFIDDKGVASFYPAKPTAITGAVQELLDAATRWDGMAGNTKANL